MRPILFLFPVLLCAASPPHLSLESLVAQSATIVEGQVVRAWSAMDSENRFTWTHYEKPGGTLNGISLLVASGLLLLQPTP